MGVMNIGIDVAEGPDRAVVSVRRGARLLCVLPDVPQPEKWTIEFSRVYCCLVAAHPLHPPLRIIDHETAVEVTPL